MEAINERFKGGSIADSCSQLYLRPLCIPKMHRGRFRVAGATALVNRIETALGRRGKGAGFRGNPR